MDGPRLELPCVRFIPSDKNQIQVFLKNQSGWFFTHTSAYGIEDYSVDITEYISACSYYTLYLGKNQPSPVSFFFHLAEHYLHVSSSSHASESDTELERYR